MLAIPAIGLVISAIFPTDLEDATISTPAGHIHDIGFLVNVVSIIPVTVLLSAGFRSHPHWRSYWRTAVTLTSLVVFAFILQFLTLHRGAPYGLATIQYTEGELTGTYSTTLISFTCPAPGADSTRVAKMNAHSDSLVQAEIERLCPLIESDHIIAIDGPIS